MVLNGRVYSILKWLLIIVVPAFITLFTLLAKAWSWNIPVEAIVTTITGVATFLGVIVGISHVNYYKEENEQE